MEDINEWNSRIPSVSFFCLIKQEANCGYSHWIRLPVSQALGNASSKNRNGVLLARIKLPFLGSHFAFAAGVNCELASRGSSSAAVRYEVVSEILWFGRIC
jgi:hypothetical protein